MYRRLGAVGYFNYLAEMNDLTEHPQLHSSAPPECMTDAETIIFALLSPAGPPPSTPSPKFDPEAAAPEENPFPESIQEYDSWTLAELKEAAKERDLPAYGTKAEIALRLKQDDLPSDTDEVEAPADAAVETESDAPADAAVTNGESTNEQPHGDTKQEPDIEE
tara:strand:+ start:74 stop:565 length:492 start_codon:yes stop_codon:yes gene_type:complete